MAEDRDKWQTVLTKVTKSSAAVKWREISAPAE
jgi:hypothetical protein